MGSESPEVQMARLDERLKAIMSELDLARDGRKQQYEAIERIGLVLKGIEGRVENVEDSLARATPTLDEFIVIKHKVIGAGILGRWAWAVVASILTFLFTIRETVIVWLSK